MLIERLRCEYAEDPIGLGERLPRFSWAFKADPGKRGQRQTAYHIRVLNMPVNSGEPDLWDSGRVESSNSVLIPYAGTPLVSRQRAMWFVEVWNDEGKSQTSQALGSDPSFFKMGLLDRSDWSAEWIGASWVGGTHTESPAPYLRKTFSLTKKISSAYLYVTALGLYECSLNGMRVGQWKGAPDGHHADYDVFTPGWTDYRKRVQYQAYDVFSLLKQGENALGAIIGDGWYCGYTGNINSRQFYGDRPKFLAQLEVTFDDGTRQTIVTDDSWQVASGPILSSDFFNGEVYDARLEMPGWDTPAFKPDQRWQPVNVFADPSIERTAMTGPTVRVVKTLRPREVNRSKQSWLGDTHIVDFGQNLVGRVRLKLRGKAGQTVHMEFVEVLDDKGQPYTANLRTAKQTDRYTLRGDPAGEVFETRFTFHGFRYVGVRGYPGELKAEDIEAEVLHSEMQQTGTFECSDPLVNQLQSNIEWGQRGNFVDVPTDCPQRNERLGWTGDAQVFARTAAFNFDVSGFFGKWTIDLRDSQSSMGHFPSYAPMNITGTLDQIDGFSNWADGGPAWADAGIICPWTMWQVYGDTRLIERHYDSMAKFIDSMLVAAKPFGLIRSHPQWKGWHGYGDWLSQDGKDGLFGATPFDLIGTAFLAYDLRLMAQMSAAIGKSDATHYNTLADEVAAAFCKRYVTPDGLIVGNTQTAYLLALHFDLLPQSQRAAAVEQLVQNIRKNGDKLNTGFVGSPYLNHVLSDEGKHDVAYQLLMQKNWPSWLYAVTQGGTTIWERWDGWTKEKGFQDAGMNSFNHYAYGAVGAWLYQRVAGIDIDPQRPGYEHIQLRPGPMKGGPLTFAKASLETVRGRVESGWKIDGEMLTYDCVIPPNVTATLTLPAGGEVRESGKSVGHGDGVFALELVSGRYQFVTTLPA